MNVGKESPQWAKDLVGHWVIFHDLHHGIEDMVAFISYTDYFDYAKPEQQVRIFADTQEAVIKEIETGTRELGLYATYIQQDKYQVIDTPAALEDWTKKKCEMLT